MRNFSQVEFSLVFDSSTGWVFYLPNDIIQWPLICAKLVIPPCECHIESSFSITRLLLPLFDADTQMLFLAGKGDNTIGFHEVNERDPILTEGLR